MKKQEQRSIEDQVKDALADTSYIAIMTANGFAGINAAYDRVQVQEVAVLHSLLMIAGMDGGVVRSSMEAALCQCVNVLGLPNKAVHGVRDRMDLMLYGIKNELLETAHALDTMQNIAELDAEDIAAAVLSARQQCILMAHRIVVALQKP